MAWTEVPGGRLTLPALVGLVGVEEGGELPGAPLHLHRVDPLHGGGGGAGPRVELVDEEHGELVLGHQGHRVLPVLPGEEEETEEEEGEEEEEVVGGGGG